MPRLSRHAWPTVLLNSPRIAVVRGVFVGGCVARGDGSSFHAMAHAHSDGDHRGWICVRAAKRLADDMLMLHELAHLSSGDGHTDRWRREVLALGGTLDAVPGSLKSFHKRPRALSPLAGNCLGCDKPVRMRSSWFRPGRDGPYHAPCADKAGERERAQALQLLGARGQA